MSFTSGASLTEHSGLVAAISDTVAIANTAFSAGTITQLTLTDKVSLADMVLTVTMAVAPAAGARFHIYRRGMNIDGANHAPVPDANFKSTYIGSFQLDLVNTIQYLDLDAVPIVADQEFYLENDTGQSTSGTTILKVNPRAYNVKA